MNVPLLPVDSEETAFYFSRCCLPLGIKLQPSHKPHQIVHRATMTLLSVGDTHCAVTCSHVYEKLVSLKTRHHEAAIVGYLMGIRNLVELKYPRLIDQDVRTLDVAILGGTSEKSLLPGKWFIDYNESILRDPKEGEPVTIVGYPAEDTEIVENVRASFAYTHLVFPISSVSDRQIILADGSGTRRRKYYGEGVPGPMGWAGISGSPAFVIRDSLARFVGIFKEEKSGTVIISRLGCIGSGGYLDRSLMPPDMWSGYTLPADD